MKLFNQCLSALNWQIMAIVGVVAAGLILCGVPSALITGSTPFLVVAACLIPCLIPFALLKRKPQPQAETQVTTQQKPETLV